MKICALCKQSLELTMFSKNKARKDGLQTFCKLCKKSYNKGYYIKTKDVYAESRADRRDRVRTDNRKAMLLYLMGKSCADCCNSDQRVLEFDHVRGEKSFTIGTVLGDHPWSRIMEEIEKCDIVCANCHRIRTSERGKWYRSSSGSSEAEHPTLNRRAEIS